MNILTASYQHFLSNPIAKPPCRMTNANMYGFFAEIEIEKTQSYIDSTLNKAATGNKTFKSLGEYALITFTDIEKIASMTPPFDQQGWMQETDIIIWLPVAQVEDGDVSHLYWYPAFICVNNIYALINGRETWGYNKYLCEYTMPSSSSELSPFSISLECFKRFSPTSKLQMHELFTITQLANEEENSLLSVLDDFPDHVAKLFKTKHLGIDFSLIQQLLKGFTNPQMDQILFKQFPDGRGDEAVYQSVIHSPSKIKKIHRFKLLKSDYALNLTRLDSFPLDDMFGLKLGSQSLHLPFYIQMDFDQLPASQI
ncbi:hypothetical protein [Pseudoalteromonas sp. H105]|uniref:hypothetical protein n=1 Tax=Pseudoalteromonas sp. H105 TaxID=1348393 RepID=UPI000731F3A7|nr:hypothetical protein [Pseudoalteromonas sp. H105]KTF18046.1 acetoacetate decarboxylase [Pseudoalteromonas sp. H105]